MSHNVVEVVEIHILSDKCRNYLILTRPVIMMRKLSPQKVNYCFLPGESSMHKYRVCILNMVVLVDNYLITHCIPIYSGFC